MNHKWILPPVGLRFFIIILLVLGVFFRFVNLDQKLFWGDECITSVRAAGFKGLYESIPRDKIITPEEMKKFQRVTQETSFLDTIEVTPPQHTPLYFLLTRVWMQWFGNSVIVMRSLTALFTVLMFPAIYWLCIELFESSKVAWMAVALMTVSPVHIIQAQNARPYSLWTLTILLSSAALLRAIRLNRKQNWVVYGVTLAFSLHSYLFSAFVAISHGIYVFVHEKFRITKTLVAYLLSLSFAILSFSPWLFKVVTNIDNAKQNTEWTGEPAPFLDLIKSWIRNLCDIFLYWNYEYEKKLFISEDIFVNYFGITLVILVAYAFYYLCRRTPKKVWLFILALTGVAALVLVLPDLLLGGRRSALSRYLFPCIVGIQITVAYLLSTKITSNISSLWGINLWKIATILLISCGVLSSTISSQTETWDGKDDFIIQSSSLINKTASPLVVSDGDIVFGLMPLNYRLASHVRLLLVSQPTAPVIPDGFSDVFLFSASEELRSKLEEQQKIHIKSAYQNSDLGNFVWKVSSPETLWKLEQ
jgi:uncharacterized membrane protein